MKLYRTKENNLINLDEVALIYKDPADNGYCVSFTNGITYEMPEIDETDIARIMEYNDYLIK
jgi:hypothetical protein